MKDLILSSLGHTWIFDLDGTILKHNGYKIDGYDTLLDGAKTFFDNVSDDDMVIFVTSRTKEYAEITEGFLNENGIPYNHIIYNAPYGERIIINDDKPSGLCMAYAINKKRDDVVNLSVKIDSEL